MDNISTVGIDIGKSVYQIHGATERGRKVFNERVSRGELLRKMRELKPVVVGLEACSGSHQLARELLAMGHAVKLMPPQYVKPYVKTNKNDAADAEACCEAVTRENMRFVEVKTAAEQAYSQLLSIRERLVGARTALVNQLHGFMREFGINVPRGAKIGAALVEVLSDEKLCLPVLTRTLVDDLLAELKALNEKICEYDKQVERIAKASEPCERLMEVPGVGALTALAVVALVGDVTRFKNGRDFSAYLGLVPRQMSSASRERLGRISKRGNPYIRKLLVQGAHAAAIRKAKHPKAQWITQLNARRGYKKMIVALANKNARIIWGILARGARYQRDHKPDWRHTSKASLKPAMVVQ